MKILTYLISFNRFLCTATAFLSLWMSSACFAQAAPPSGPGGACPGNTCPSPGYYPNTVWPFTPPALLAKAIPTVDANSAFYLPYLPWMASNMAALVNYSDFFYQLAKNNNGNGSTIPYDSTGTASANNLLIQTQASNMTASASQTQENLQKFLSFDPTNIGNYFSGLPFVTGTDSAAPCTGNSCPSLPNDSAFNADSIFGVTGYPAVQQDGTTPTPQSQAINNLILFLTNTLQSAPDPGLSADPATRQAQLKNATVQNYLLQLRAASAIRSMALSNFNYLAKERAIIPGLGTNAGMVVIPSAGQCGKTPKSIADASQLQVDKYLIDRRSNNPCWYASVNSASPLAIQRETLYVMTEIQRQLYENQMLQERILSTLSTMQVAMTANTNNVFTLQANNVQSCLKNPSTCGQPG